MKSMQEKNRTVGQWSNTNETSTSNVWMGRSIVFCFVLSQQNNICLLIWLYFAWIRPKYQINMNEGLKTILESTNSRAVWIFTDIRSSIKYIQVWNRVCELLGIQIISKLKILATIARKSTSNISLSRRSILVFKS